MSPTTMHKDVYTQNMELVKQVYFLLGHIDIAGLLRAMESAEAIGPILAPTLYRENGRKLAEEIEVVKALLPAKRFAASPSPKT